MPNMPNFVELTNRLRRSIVQVLPGGSGVIWNARGDIVTNAHVATGDGTGIVDVTGRRSVGRVIMRDKDRDLALIQVIPVTQAPAADIGDSDSVRAGQLVIALGNPLGLTGAVAAGIIHNAGPVARRDWIQADVRLAPGNSGGMLADAMGRVIGITTMIANGLAFAVPSNEVDAFVSSVYLKKTA
jgi:serine protease Do